MVLLVVELDCGFLTSRARFATHHLAGDLVEVGNKSVGGLAAMDGPPAATRLSAICFLVSLEENFGTMEVVETSETTQGSHLRRFLVHLECRHAPRWYFSAARRICPAHSSALRCLDPEHVSFSFSYSSMPPIRLRR